MKAPRPDIEYRPGIRQLTKWEAEWRDSGSKESLQWFVMIKAADYAADIELKLWCALVNDLGFRGMARTYEKERRPPAPEPTIRRGEFLYRLVEDDSSAV